MNDSEVDMDELEARLYGQVHHMPDYTEDVATQPNLQNNPANNVMRYYNRPISTPIQCTQTANYDKFGVYSIPVMSPPVNNIVVLPPPPTQIFTHRSHSQKWVEQIIQACSKNKRALRKLKEKRRRDRKKLVNASQTGDSMISTIDLSESCEPEDLKNVCLISDDESNGSDDVIIVETKAEVINVDCETEPVAPEPPALPPDSLNVCDSNASFDFLEGTSLCKGKTSTPNAKTERNETDSGRSSTLDYCENLTGREIAGPSSSTFSELNLDGFTSYIASNGKRSADDASLSISLASKRVRQVSANSSDSSSESDTESLPEVDPKSESARDDEECGVQKEEEVVTVNESVPLEVSVVDIDTVAEENEVICIEDDNSSPSVEVSADNTHEGFSKYWTDDMDQFYKESWGQEDFSVIEQQRLMSDDPSMWRVIAKDRLNTVKSRDPRCRRCLEFGHLAFKCTTKLNPVTCCLCGTKGHRENRCPNTVCTSCGLKTPCYTTFCQRCVSRQHIKCSICDMFGHADSHCPDLWRRYLFTTREGEVQRPEAGDEKRLEDLWCSGCGTNGHVEQHCRYYRSHAAVSATIHSFQSVYISKPNSPEVAELVQDWHISSSKNKYLVGKEASIFLKTLQKKTAVNVSIKETPQNLHLLLSGGTEESQSSVKDAIQRFIAAKKLFAKQKQLSFSKQTATVQSLETNLNTLEDDTIDWRGVARSTYTQINRQSLSMQDCSTETIYKEIDDNIKSLYQKLNTIIIAKLDSKSHMDTLQKCLDTGSMAFHSFHHVFNSDHSIFPNYNELIAELPCASTPNFEEARNEAVAVCKRRKFRVWLKTVLHYYSCLIISNYSEKYVPLFQLACSRASAAKNDRKKK
uniref:Zinc finger CCHC domain-containing protein 7 n=1 Tax=Photinus pyralis TaxID=7054 RepID=A0A1Y1LXH2_PHOPY